MFTHCDDKISCMHSKFHTNRYSLYVINSVLEQDNRQLTVSGGNSNEINKAGVYKWAVLHTQIPQKILSDDHDFKKKVLLK